MTKTKLETDLEGLSPDQFKKAKALFSAEDTRRGTDDGPSVGELELMPEHEHARHARAVTERYAGERARSDAKKLLGAE